jgi:hypothetical protein
MKIDLSDIFFCKKLNRSIYIDTKQACPQVENQNGHLHADQKKVNLPQTIKYKV